MKREHSIDDEYIQWLKSLGCVLYLPLDEENGMKDLIGGNILQKTSDTTGYFQWDSNVGMYFFHNPSSQNTRSYTLQTNWDSAVFAANKFTILTTFKRKSTSGFPFSYLLGSGYGIPAGAILSWNGTGNMQNWGDDIHKCAAYFGADNRKYYQDGTLFNTYAAYTPYLPSSWGSYLYSVGCGSDGYPSVEHYSKDVMMFNRELTLAEIRKIQGYE